MKTDNNEIQYSDYIKPDETEELVRENSKEGLSELQEQNRGISYMEDNKVNINARAFAQYHNARRFRQVFIESLKEQGIAVDIVKNSVDVYVGIIVTVRKP